MILKHYFSPQKACSRSHSPRDFVLYYTDTATISNLVGLHTKLFIDSALFVHMQNLLPHLLSIHLKCYI